MATKKGASKGTGGHGRRRLEGRGPTPKAEERESHPAARRARAVARAKAGATPSRSSAASRPRSAPAPDEIVVGRNAVVEALRASVPAGTLYLATGIERDARISDALKLAANASIPVLEGSRPDLDRIAGGPHHQGIALQVKPFSYAHPDDVIALALESADPALLVALDGVTDPHNLGAVARSAAAFGAHGLIVPERRAAGVTASAWKASAGALARIPVARAGNLNRAIEACATAGLMVAGLDGDGEVDIADLELSAGPLLLIVGSEGAGLSRLVGEHCDVRVRIPLSGGVESLNASVAAGIALAAVAQRRARP